MATLIIRFGLDTMVPEVKDQLIAPKISELSTPNPPDISASRKHPLSAFIFNLDLSLVLSNQKRQACFNFIRNVEAAFDEYCEARTALLSHLQSDGRTVVAYFSALRQYEHCLAHLYHAVLSANVFGNEKQFENGDGSILDRVCTIHNHIKHMDEKYNKAPIRDEMSFKTLAKTNNARTRDADDLHDVASGPFWLTNEGLECRQTRVSYSELAEEVISVLGEAIKIAALKPKSATQSPSKP